MLIRINAIQGKRDVAQNKIIKLNLETRARELREDNKSTWEIARVLSEEAGQKVTQSSVQRYFASFELEKKQAIEKREKLVAKVAEAEINTIEKRQKVVDELLSLAEDAKKAKDFKAAAAALKEINPILVSLDQLSGKLSTQQSPGVVVNVNTERLKERMKVYDAIFDAEQE